MEPAHQHTDLASTWIKYDQPVNGYEIRMHCVQEERGSSFFKTNFYLSKGNRTLSFSQMIFLEFEKPWGIEGVKENDTLYIHNTHRTAITQKLDWQNIIYFDDVDFDGKNELIVCGYVKPKRQYENMLDCEDFTIYKITGNGISRVRNVAFDELSHGKCRTDFLFDRKEKRIVFRGYPNGWLTIEKVFWFKKGMIYAMDYNVLDEDFGKHYFHRDISQDESTEVISWMNSIRTQIIRE